MGTQWRGLLAPINQSTDDGRRFRSFTNRTLPLGMKWQRQDDDGHDSSVVVGSTDTINYGTVAEAVKAGWISKEAAAAANIDPAADGVWGSGELFDDVDAATMPRLAEDVAEAKHLLEKGVIAPSVDPIPVGAVLLVEPGQDEAPTPERWDALFAEYEETGVEPVLEVLFAEGLIAAATLVVTPAFSEVRPFELLAPELVPASALTAADRTRLAVALTAAAGVTSPVYPPDVFENPGLTRVTPITVVDKGEGFLRVQGYAAKGGTCHIGYTGVCYTPPLSDAGYMPFHRYPVEVEGGELVGAGRITTGFGAVGTGCTCCRGKGDHACDNMPLGATLSHYDQLTTLAYVRAGHTEDGSIWVAGVVHPDVDAAGLAALRGQKFSGDWRDVAGNLELVEVLALSPSDKPGFPIPATSVRDGRQVSLTAAGVVRPLRTGGPVSGGFMLDYPTLGREVASSLAALGTTVTWGAPAGTTITTTDGAMTTTSTTSVTLCAADAAVTEETPAAPDVAEDPADDVPADIAEHRDNLAAEVEAALDALDARERAEAAVRLLAELEGVGV